jgi:phosphatidylglycerophosphate synthase
VTGPAGPALLAASGLGLVVLALTTAARPVAPVPDRAGYFDRWSALHGGYDPRAASVWVRGWLTLVYLVGRPLARRGVSPDVVTLAAVWLALAVLVTAAHGGRWSLLAGGLLVASGLFDSLDGCVAVLQGRPSRWGYVLDSVVDRVSDALHLAAAVAVGAPGPLAVVCGVGVFLLEYARARAANAGGDEVGRITVGERPTRVILLSGALLGAGGLPSYADAAATGGVAVLAGFTAVGLGQLLVAVRRQLAALPPP